MLVYLRLFVAIAICLTGANALQAQDYNAISEPVKAELLHDENSIQPGRPFWLAIRLKIADHWHTYWKNPGDTGMAMNLNWTLPEGFSVKSVEWPAPKKFNLDSLIGYGYEEEAILLAEIVPPQKVEKLGQLNIGANIRWVVCSDSNCVPGDQDLEVSLPLNEALPEKNAAAAKVFAKAFSQLPKKDWKLSGLQKNDLIEIKAEAPDNTFKTVSKAYFCPETKAVCNEHAELVVTKSAESNAYTIALPGAETNVKTLKGVLVLLTDDQAPQTVASIDVQIPLQSNNEEDVAIATDAHQLPSLAIDSLALTESTTSEQPLSFGWALIFAFVGGMILNLMPCVLPVVSCKILSFVKMAGQSRATTFKHGLAFAGGVLVSFWALAGVLLGLQAYGQSAGWGFQLQEPFFVSILAAVFFVFALSLFGIFEMGVSVTAWAGQAQQKGSVKPESMLSSFLSGVLATAVATPCTGPFLGSAVGFAVTLKAPLAMLIFTSLGIGMAFPYLLLSANPSLLRFMPKPGEWMVTFKELMGFLMLATVLWLVWVFGAQTSNESVFELLTAFFFLGLGAWIYGKWGTPVKAFKTRIASSVFALSCATLAIFAMISATNADKSSLTGNAKAKVEMADGWEEFSPTRVAELRGQGKPVFIDFTAKWCLICQTNHVVLSNAQVQAKMNEIGVVRMKADWTKKDPAITEALRQYGRNSLPLYVLYGNDPEQPAKILPQVLTPDLVINHLTELENDNIAEAK